MNILGLAYGFHDSSAALVQNGKLVAAASEERFTRQKHDSFFPQFSIDECLQKGNLAVTDLDLVVFYENSPQKFTRILSSVLKDWPLSQREFSQSMKTWLGSKLWSLNQITHHLGVEPSKILTIGHHEAHAYQAFIGSQFQDAAILTVDAVGEWSTTSLWEAQWMDGKPKLKLISESEYPHSLGLFYSAMTAYLGFKPMNDECTIMALAAFGTPLYANFFRKILKVDQGKVWLDPSFFQFDQFFQSPFRKGLLAELGPQAGSEKLSFSSFENKTVTAEEQRLADIAASVQLVFEEKMLELAAFLKANTQSSNLSLAGGAGLNCVANTKLLKEAGFENLFIPVDPGDGGASIGAAYAGYFTKSQSNPKDSLYQEDLGPADMQESSFAEMLAQIKISQLKKFAKFSQSDVVDWKVTRFEDMETLCQRAAQELFNYQIVGWFQDGFEFGPRALGHRSILIRPDHLDLANRLSQKVKERATFRPYALSMTKKAADLILDLDARLLGQRPLQWMQLAVSTRLERRRQIKAGLHIDGSTRPQIVSEVSTKYCQLLKAYGRLSGLDCLLNTSFNESGYPMVRTPTEALLMFARTDMDILIVGQVMVQKVRTPYAR